MSDEAFFNKLRDKIISACTQCHGSGYLQERTCDCLIEFRAQHRLLIGNFAPHLLGVDMDWISQNMSFGESEKYVTGFAENPGVVRGEGLSLYIWSERRGVGKTTLAHVLAKQLAKHFAKEENYSRTNFYRFMEVGQFFDLARKTTTQKYQQFLVDWDATLFVLDDFGNEDRSARWEFEFISKLIQDFLRHRTRLKLPTIITTNTRPEEVSQQYQEDISSLLEVQPSGRIGGLLWREIHVTGRDLRLDTEMSPWKTVDAPTS